MLLDINTAVLHLNAWSLSCPCHAPLPSEEAGAVTATDKQPACPLAGRRAPELAGGRFAALVHELCNVAETSVVLRLRDLAEKDRHGIMDDFHRGRAQLVFVLLASA
eukprot:5181980-Lingulodinium_polyedra.AAC.1